MLGSRPLVQIGFNRCQVFPGPHGLTLKPGADDLDDPRGRSTRAASVKKRYLVDHVLRALDGVNTVERRIREPIISQSLRKQVKPVLVRDWAMCSCTRETVRPSTDTS